MSHPFSAGASGSSRRDLSIGRTDRPTVRANARREPPALQLQLKQLQRLLCNIEAKRGPVSVHSLRVYLRAMRRASARCITDPPRERDPSRPASELTGRPRRRRRRHGWRPTTGAPLSLGRSVVVSSANAIDTTISHESESPRPLIERPARCWPAPCCGCEAGGGHHHHHSWRNYLAGPEAASNQAPEDPIPWIHSSWHELSDWADRNDESESLTVGFHKEEAGADLRETAAWPRFQTLAPSKWIPRVRAHHAHRRRR